MSKTHGRTALPLPASLRTGLEGLGMVVMTATEPPVWRHPLAPELRLTVVASNIPGDTAVLATWGTKPDRVEADVLLAQAFLKVEAARRGESRMPLASTPND